jgi:hypothetical protein
VNIEKPIDAVCARNPAETLLAIAWGQGNDRSSVSLRGEFRESVLGLGFGVGVGGSSGSWGL